MPSRKLSCFFLCLLVLPGLLVMPVTGQGGGMLGGGKKGHHGGIEALLVAGLLAKILRQPKHKHHCGHHHVHHGHHGHHG
ncbi:hypothetical protein JTE90_011077 [Oedothorax gibbosus]|uniref:Uncharacterized protein n=1 Tax=Oedothorax gibbosus TaxID=931172 RepID=A0AAV6ULC0_9ARAC|nr:hypothetical protein JTE90_011077 [Oedothorax gibbosus]